MRLKSHRRPASTKRHLGKRHCKQLRPADTSREAPIRSAASSSSSAQVGTHESPSAHGYLCATVIPKRLLQIAQKGCKDDCKHGVCNGRSGSSARFGNPQGFTGSAGSEPSSGSLGPNKPTKGLIALRGGQEAPTLRVSHKLFTGRR